VTDVRPSDENESIPLTRSNAGSQDSSNLNVKEWNPNFKIIPAEDAYEFIQRANTDVSTEWVLKASVQCADKWQLLTFFEARLYFNNSKRQYVLCYDVQSTFLLQFEWYSSKVISKAIEFANEAVAYLTTTIVDPFPPVPLIIAGKYWGGILAQVVTVALKSNAYKFHAHAMSFDAPVTAYSIVEKYIPNGSTRFDIANFFIKENLELSNIEGPNHGLVLYLRKTPGDSSWTVVNNDNVLYCDTIISFNRIEHLMLEYLKKLERTAKNPMQSSSAAHGTSVFTEINPADITVNSTEDQQTTNDLSLSKSSSQVISLGGMEFDIDEDKIVLPHDINFAEFVPRVAFAILVAIERSDSASKNANVPSREQKFEQQQFE
jgi:hypothetical protein